MKLKNLLISFGASALLLSVGVGLVSSRDDMVRTEAATITEGTTLYLTPSTNWKEGNARFAAYFFNPATWVSMTEVDGDAGTYQVTAPLGGFSNVIFCRMNPGNATNSWDTKWNQTADLTYDGTNNWYTVKEGTWDKGGGAWAVYGGDAPEIEEDPVTWGIAGSMNEWGFISFTNENGDETAELEVELTAGTEFKFHDGSWGTSYGTQTFVTDANKDYFEGDKNNDNNVKVIKSGTYTFTAPAEKAINALKSENMLLGTDITFTCVEKEMPVYTLTAGAPIYLQTSWDGGNWSSDGAKFGLYFFNDGGSAFSADFMTEVKGAATKMYEGVVPGEEGVQWTTVIAIRFNSEASELRWNTDEEKLESASYKNVWNQTNDITVIENMNVINITGWNNGEAATTFTAESRAYVWAEYFLSLVNCNAAGSNDLTEENWTDLKTQYEAMHVEAQQILKDTVAAEEEDNLKKAMLKYDYIVDKYADSASFGKAWMVDFIGRVSGEGSNNRLVTTIMNNNNNMIMIIVISSIIAVSAIGVFFVYKRKRNVQ